MRRKPNPEISDRARNIERMIREGSQPDQRNRAQGLALLLLGIELLEDLGVAREDIRHAFDRALDATSHLDPRSDTSGT